jgi:hypothetical protein
MRQLLISNRLKIVYVEFLFNRQINSGNWKEKLFFSAIVDWTDLFKNKLKEVDAIKVVGTDLLSLTVVKTPKEMGAHVTYGNS